MMVFAAVLGLSVVIIIHEMGHFFVAKASGVRVDEFGIGFPPRLFGWRKGETEYTVNAIPFGGFVRVHGEGRQEEDDKDATRSFATKSLGKKLGILVAGVTMNFLFGWFVLAGSFIVGAPEHLMVASISQDSPAAIAELKAGDVITQAAWSGTTLTDPVSVDAFITLTRQAAGASLVLTVERGGFAREITLVGRVAPPEGEGPLGIALAPVGAAPQPFLSAVSTSFLQSVAILRDVVAGFARLVAGVFTDLNVLREVSGPVGIVALTAQSGALGVAYFCQLLALISLNLVVLNLIPFPALDGGRMLLVVIERLIRRPVPRRVELVVNGIGFAALLTLMAVVTVQDVGKLWG
jgi:regulator of sigma E protease